MSVDLAVWRSSDPEILALQEKWDAEEREFSESVSAFLKRHDPSGQRQAVLQNSAISGRQFIGMSHSPGLPIPPGWRLERKHLVLVPALSRKEGKAVAEELGHCQPRDYRSDLPGMPRWTMEGMSVTAPGVEVLDGLFYVIWSGESVASQIDESVWERVRLSEYYLLKEAAEAKEAEAVSSA